MEKHLEWTTKNSIILSILVFFVFIFFFILKVLFGSFFGYWDNKINDQIFILKAKIKKPDISPEIIHVDVNDSTIFNMNISMFDRNIYSNLVNNLTELGVKSIIFDINFQENLNEEVDKRLVEIFKKHSNVYIPVIPQKDSSYESLTLDEKYKEIDSIIQNQLFRINTRGGKPIIASKVISNFPELQKITKRIGHIAVEADDDGIFRRLPVVIKYKDGYIPFVSLSLLYDYLNVKDIEIVFGKYLKLKECDFGYGNIYDVEIPIDNNGKVIINYFGKWGTFKHFSAQTILQMKKEDFDKYRDTFNNSIVIISDITTRGKDYGNIPIEKVYPLSGIHSNFLNSILQNQFIKTIGVMEEIFFLFFIALILTLMGSFFRNKLFTIFSFLFFITIEFFIIFLFIYGNIQIPQFSLIISFVVAFIVAILYRYITEEKLHLNYVLSLNRATSRFVPKEFLTFLGKSDILQVKLGDQIKTEMTILFSDIRGFTSISEKMTPFENFNFINDYLSTMGPIIRENNGFIDKYIGDAIMALFARNPQDGINAGVAMIKKLADYNIKRKRDGLFTIDVGVGLHTGVLMLGIVGENERYDGTVISDSVNLASRLEGLTKYYGANIIVSGDLFDRVDRSNYIYRYLDRVKVKGKNEPIDIYEIIVSTDFKDQKLKIETIKIFQEAFNLYKEGDFDGAKRTFMKVLEINPDDKAAKLFLTRIEHFGNLPPTNWDGVYALDEK